MESHTRHLNLNSKTEIFPNPSVDTASLTDQQTSYKYK